MAAHKTTWTAFSDWTLVNLTDTGSGLQVDSGYTTGTATIQYEATGWATGLWRVLSVLGVRPDATIYYLRFKTATLQAGLAGATWSDYINGVSDSGVITFDMRTWCRNNAAWDVGPHIEIEITLDTS